MTKAEIWDIIVSKTDHRDRDYLRLFEHSAPEDWIARILSAAVTHIDSERSTTPSIGATTYARARR